MVCPRCERHTMMILVTTRGRMCRPCKHRVFPETAKTSPPFSSEAPISAYEDYEPQGEQAAGRTDGAHLTWCEHVILWLLFMGLAALAWICCHSADQAGRMIKFFRGRVRRSSGSPPNLLTHGNGSTPADSLYTERKS